ncbi:MAG: Hsp20/alpha crystallin family protein [Spirochaetia bacterium]|nr:Hsp20/alpha crystallin family protein [Spirochaetia bacterium]
MLQEAKKDIQTEVERASTKRTYMPAVDIFEDETTVILYADMPGVDEKGVDITLEKNILTIDGKTDFDQSETHPIYKREYGVGDYHRSFQLNDEFDSEKISAVVKNGVLQVFLPRMAPTKKKISVTAG